MEPNRTAIHTTPCAFRQIRWSFPTTECQRVHVCPVCACMFRAQPPFLRPRAIYTLRVVQKAIEAVYHDRMAMRCVPDRLARDFWVKPAEKMVRLWCRAYADKIDFAGDYRVVANFSGILCVDEVYQGDLALLLAVDPAAPDGDRLVGYTLVPKTREVDQGMVKAFVDRLRSAAITPDQIITDDSRLYPSVLAETWRDLA